MLLNNMFFVFSSCLNGNHNTKLGHIALRYKGAKNSIGKGVSGKSYAIPFRKQKMDFFSEKRIFFEVLDFFDFAQKNPQMQFQITNLTNECPPLKNNNLIYLFSDKPDNCHISGSWNKFLDNKEERIAIYIDDEIKNKIEETTFFEIVNKYTRNLQNKEIVHNDTLIVKNYNKRMNLPETIIPKDYSSFSSKHLTNVFNIRDLLWYSNNILVLTDDKNKLLIRQIKEMAIERNLNVRIVDYLKK